MEETLERGWLLPVFVAIIGAFMSILDSSIVNVAISTMMHVFGAGTEQIEWVVTVYLLAMAVVIPMTPWAGDRFGYKQLYIFSLIVFTAGSFLCAASTSINMLIFARIVQAVGGGILMPAMMTMVKRIVPAKKFGAAIGLVGIALLLAPALGPTIGGYLVEYMNWSWIFTINIPIGIAGVILAFAFLPQFTKIKNGKLDIGGAISAAMMLFSLLLALSKGNDWGWSSQPVVMLLYTSACTFVLFVYLEMTNKNPLLNLRLFKHRTFTMANLTMVIATIGNYAGLFYIPLFLQNIKGMGALDTGLLMLPGALITGLMMPVAGKLYDKVGPKPIAIFGVFSLAYTTYLLHGIDINTPATTVMIWLILRGIAITCITMPAQATALEVPEKDVGAASAISNTVSRVGASFGLAVLTSVLTGRIAFHSAIAAWGITTSNPGVAQLMQKYSAASATGISSVQGLITRDAYIRGLGDIFLISTIIVIIGILPVVFLKKGGASKQNSSAVRIEPEALKD